LVRRGKKRGKKANSLSHLEGGKGGGGRKESSKKGKKRSTPRPSISSTPEEKEREDSLKLAAVRSEKEKEKVSQLTGFSSLASGGRQRRGYAASSLPRLLGQYEREKRKRARTLQILLNYPIRPICVLEEEKSQNQAADIFRLDQPQ